MTFTLRWFGPDDPVKLDAIREPALPGYGLVDRAIGLGYLHGIVAECALRH